MGGAATDLYEVAVARHGTWRTTRGQMFRNPIGGRADEPFTIDYYLWAIIGDTRTVLVDTGFSAAQAARRNRIVVRSPADHLEALGIAPSWDGDVVLTHLHYDHTGFVSFLPHARLHVSAAEFDFRFTEGQSDIALTSTEDLAVIRDAHLDGRLQLHHGDAGLAPGIELLLVPGHTPGELLVRVQTPGGPVVLTSDVAHFDEEYQHDAMFRWMTDPDAASASYERLRQMREAGDEIVTGHEPGLITRYSDTSQPFGPETALVRPRRRQ